MSKFVKKIIKIVVFIFIISKVQAQQNHFIYIQSENKQPFYVKINKKIISSSTSGYVILPKLQEGSYIITIGFPKNEWTEQNLKCIIDKKDVGYILKNFGEKGWGLFNFQSYVTTMPITAETVQTVAIVDTPKTQSSIVMATTKIEEVHPKIDSIEKTPNIKDTSVATIEPAIETISKIKVVKVLNDKTEEGREMIYITTDDKGLQDTVRVFIPIAKDSAIPNTLINKVDEVKKIDTLTAFAEAPKVVNSNTENKNFIDINLPNPNNTKISTDSTLETTKQVVKDELPQIETTKDNKNQTKPNSTEKSGEATKMIIQNSDCKAVADNDDFLKVRKKMAAEKSEDAMVAIAYKTFKIKCFSTDQIKNLSFLFLNDSGKYKFYDTAYPYVTDSFNFSILQSQLSDEYYINRFKAMIKH